MWSVLSINDDISLKSPPHIPWELCSSRVTLSTHFKLMGNTDTWVLLNPQKSVKYFKIMRFRTLWLAEERFYRSSMQWKSLVWIPHFYTFSYYAILLLPICKHREPKKRKRRIHIENACCLLRLKKRWWCKDVAYLFDSALNVTSHLANATFVLDIVYLIRKKFQY